jgi:hypothetical protein
MTAWMPYQTPENSSSAEDYFDERKASSYDSIKNRFRQRSMAERVFKLWEIEKKEGSRTLTIKRGNKFVLV